MNAIFAAGLFNEVGGNLVSQAAGSKMNATPEPVRFIHQQIHVMVAASHRSQLAAGQVLQATHFFDVPGRVVVEQLVVGFLLVGPTNPESDLAPDVIHDAGDVGARLTGRHVQTNRLVSTGDVKPHSGWTHLVLIGHDSANRNGIA